MSMEDAMEMEIGAGEASWLQSYTPTWWVAFLQELGGGMPFPDPTAAESDWSSFFLQSMSAPLAIFAVGTLLVTFLPAALWCSRPRKPWRTKPSCAAPFCLFLVSSLVLLGFAWGTFNKTSQAISNLSVDLRHGGESFEQAGNVLKVVSDQCVPVFNTGTLKGDPCLINIVRLGRLLGTGVRNMFLDGMLQCDKFSAVLGDVSKSILRAGSRVDAMADVALVAMIVPAGLTGLLLLSILFDLMMARCSRTPRRSAGCGLMLAPGLLAGVLLATFSELGVGVAMGSFCLNVDTNAANLAEFSLGSETKGSDLAKFYITGLGENPVAEIADAQETISFALVTLRDQCADWKSSPALQCMGMANESSAEYIRLMDPKRMYPNYQQVMHNEICGEGLDALALAVISQCLLCLICLPVVIASASRYLGRLGMGSAAKDSGKMDKVKEARRFEDDHSRAFSSPPVKPAWSSPGPSPPAMSAIPAPTPPPGLPRLLGTSPHPLDLEDPKRVYEV